MNEILSDWLADALRELRKYKTMAERAAAQVPEEQWFTRLDPESNSIAILMKHLAGTPACPRLPGGAELPKAGTPLFPRRGAPPPATLKGVNSGRHALGAPMLEPGFRRRSAGPVS